jgi:hypothetical protein
MTWQNDDYVTDVGNGVCPVCGRSGCMLKVRFRGGPARSLDRPIDSMYTNCCSDCPGGINTHLIGSSSRMSRAEARSFLYKIGNDLAHEMARRI